MQSLLFTTTDPGKIEGMDIVWWAITVALVVVGLIGTLLPLVPGAVLILCGAVVGHFAVGAVGWGTLIGLTLLMILAQVVDLVSGSLGAKWFGATRWGAIGAIFGAVIGLFFGIIGILVGPLIGALVGELLGGRGLLPAGKSTWGTFLGTTAGILGKFAISLIMVVWFAVAAVMR